MATTTVTVMFCDVVASTDHRARLGEVAADQFFKANERVLREVVGRHDGNVLKGAGDGIMAAFSAASDAVSAAVALHDRLDFTTPQIELRIGVAAGDVSWEGDDCFGMPVVVAARLESACPPKGVLVSAVVRHMAGDRAAVDFRHLGALDLRGVPEPVEAFEVTWLRDRPIDTRWTFPATLPGGTKHPFVGRDAEVLALDAVWNRVNAGGHGLALLAGDAGAGKTRLATEFAQLRHQNGAIVLCGLCDRDLSLPYQPWVMALDQLVHQLPRDALDGIRDDLSPLQDLVPSLEDVVGGLGRVERIDPDAARHRLYHSVVRLLDAAAHEAPLSIVIDDLHWAGRQTLDLLRFVTKNAPIPKCMFVATLRDTGDEISEDLAALLADLRRMDGVVRLKVDGIGADAVFELLEALGSPGDRRAHANEIAERTKGNAFLVSELALHADGSGEAVPESVIDVVDQRLNRLSRDARTVAHSLAVAGRIELTVLIDIARTSDMRLAEVISELTDTGLVDELADRVPAFQYSHALIRDAVASKVASIERFAIHEEVALAIERVHETDRRPVLTQLARHFAAAAPVAGWHKAAYYGRRAAAQARRTAAYEEAIELIHTSLDVTPGGTEERVKLLIDAVDLLERCGRNPEAVDLAAEAAEVALELGDVELEARAAIEQERAAHLGNSSFERCVPRLQHILEQHETLPDGLRCRVRASLGRAKLLSGMDGAHELIESALEIARALDDPATLSHSLEMACVAEEDPHVALRLAAELHLVTERVGNIFQSMWAMTRQTDALLTLGRLEEARIVLHQLDLGAQRYRYTTFRYLSYAFSHTLALAAADFERAETMAQAADVGAQAEFAEIDVSGAFGLQMFMVRRAQGRLEEMRPILQLLAGSHTGGIWAPGLILALTELGMLEEAERQFDELQAIGFESIPRDTLWPLALMFLADTCATLARKEAARVLLAEFDVFAGVTLRAGYTTNGGPADRARAVLAELTGDSADADRCIEAATKLAHSSGSPLWEAQVEATSAWLWARRGDAEKTASHHAAARALADRYGIGAISSMPPVCETVEVGTSTRGAGLIDGLSGREVEVLAEVAKGRTNRQIAQHLHISQNTAANHVRAILRKTASANRTEAARYAHLHGLTDVDPVPGT